MPRKIYFDNQKNEKKGEKKETLAERKRRKEKEKVKAEVQAKLAQELEEKRNRELAEIEDEIREVSRMEEEYRESVKNANVIINEANAKLEELRRARQLYGKDVEQRQKEYEDNDVGEEIKVEPTEVALRLKYREYRRRKIDEYKEKTGDYNIEPEPGGMTVITIDKKVIKINQEDLAMLQGNDSIIKLIGKQEAPYIEAVIMGKGIIKIKNHLFYSYHFLTEVIFNEDLEEIGKVAFVNTAIKELVLPPDLKKINSDAFSGCSDLEKMTSDGNLEEIGKGAFQRTGLQEVILPKSLKTIESWAFSDCTKLKKVVFGENIQDIRIGAFQNTEIQEVELPESTEIYDKETGFTSFEREVKVTRKTPKEIRASRISHQDVAKAVARQLLDGEKIYTTRRDLVYRTQDFLSLRGDTEFCLGELDE